MRRSLFVLLATAALAPPACAQSAAVQPCTAAPAADTSNATARELRARYDQIADAVRREDLGALAALYAPDLTVLMPNGQTWNYDQSLAYSRAGFAQVDSTILSSNRIAALRVCGARATATVLQQWARIQRIGGVPRRMETAAVQDETWVRGPNGWRRALIEHITMGMAFLDGVPIDPTRPRDTAPPAPPPAGGAPTPR
jgi:ketosteroid isomerase-like protein